MNKISNLLKIKLDRNKMIILIAIIFLFFSSALVLLFMSKDQELELSSEAYVSQNEVKQEQEANYTFDFSNVEFKDVKGMNDVNESIVPDLSSVDAEKMKQEEMIRKIKKKKKPKDMIAYLKSIQKDFDFKSNSNSFKYDLKEYIANDKFKDWWKIEKIGGIYIRFEDDEYSYNLRFLGE